MTAGLARHVLVYRTVTEAGAQGGDGRSGIGLDGGSARPGRVGGFLQWTLPFGAYSAANWVALHAARHMHQYGTTREQMAQVPLNGRRNAGLNPAAVYIDPLTLDDYFAARMISTPFCLRRAGRRIDGLAPG